MSFPQPGDTNVRGFVAWCRFVPGINKHVGMVEAYASIYGTPLAYRDVTQQISYGYSGGDPLSFSFTSDVAIGGDVLFDIAQATYAAYATNIREI